MSEQIEEVTGVVTPEQQAPAAPALSPEQFETIKRSLIETLHKHYGQFINSINHFPLAQMPMQQAFLHFDTGFLWFEKAIVNMPVPQAQVMQVPQPKAPESALEPQAQEASQTAEVIPIDAA